MWYTNPWSISDHDNLLQWVLKKWPQWHPRWGEWPRPETNAGMGSCCSHQTCCWSFPSFGSTLLYWQNLNTPVTQPWMQTECHTRIGLDQRPQQHRFLWYPGWRLSCYLNFTFLCPVLKEDYTAKVNSFHFLIVLCVFNTTCSSIHIEVCLKRSHFSAHFRF
jgi:hypothetical protein